MLGKIRDVNYAGSKGGSMRASWAKGSSSLGLGWVLTVVVVIVGCGVTQWAVNQLANSRGEWRCAEASRYRRQSRCRDVVGETVAHHQHHDMKCSGSVSLSLKRSMGRGSLSKLIQRSGYSTGTANRKAGGEHYITVSRSKNLPESRPV